MARRRWRSETVPEKDREKLDQETIDLEKKGAGQRPWEQGMGQNEERLSPEEAAALYYGGRSMPERPIIGQKEIEEAASLLQKYKSGKANLENRVVEDELWWELRHWEVIRRKKALEQPEPTSAWLFNSLINKHADAMDNYPEPVVLPREQSDEDSARTLSSVLPVIMEYNGFHDTYSDNWWEKLKHGTAVYGVFWNPGKENGLGDVDIRPIDLLKIFWEPGITDIQKSRNLFLVDLVDTDILEEQYPQYKGKLSGGAIDVKQYIYDESIDTSGKSLVVDWYYKVRSPDGRTLLQYVKFAGNSLLYASENDPSRRQKGWYAHGLYPIVLDTLFPEKGTPVGFGYIAITKDPQLYVDKLSANILQTSMMGSKKRFFVSDSTAINEEEFCDWNRPLVHVYGELDEKRIQEIGISPPSGTYLDVMLQKIDELKETSANRDVNSGGTGSGVTAAAAIAALQEAGNKVSRDMISASYRAYVKINTLCIELIREFYDENRSFRITGEAPGGFQFIQFNNSGVRDQMLPPDSPAQALDPGYEALYRRPVFDIDIRAQKKNPFSRMEQNERAKELYSMGFFSPERAQESLLALDMMDFEGIEKIREQVSQGQTLMNVIQQMNEQIAQMAAMIRAMTGEGAAKEGQGEKNSGEGAREERGTAGASGMGGRSVSPSRNFGGDITGAVMQAQKESRTSYGTKLAERSRPDVDFISKAATPK